MPKIAFIGAGSVVFAKNLLGDILLFDELKESDIALMDIDAERLRAAERMTRKLAEATGSSPRVAATLDRREAHGEFILPLDRERMPEDAALA
ncbi:MAG: hypothetical protein IH851_04250 [Armatimonadetes bacterium]|nr:hypothetical protein [Armatimonadota bacterium]